MRMIYLEIQKSGAGCACSALVSHVRLAAAPIKRVTTNMSSVTDHTKQIGLISKGMSLTINPEDVETIFLDGVRYDRVGPEPSFEEILRMGEIMEQAAGDPDKMSDEFKAYFQRLAYHNKVSEH